MSKVREEFIYLNKLRESGATNMWGASSYLATAFDIPQKKASKIFLEWIEWTNENPFNIVIGPSGLPTLKP